MTPVASEDKVFRLQTERLSDRSGLFSDIQVCRAGIHVFDPIEALFRTDGKKHVFKFPDIAHVPPDREQVFFGISSSFDFFLYTSFVGEDRNIRKPDIAFRKNLFRVVKLFF